MKQFTLTQEQYKKLYEWKDAIKVVFGVYGLYTYSFIEDGIGISVHVKCNLCDAILDLTQYGEF